MSEEKTKESKELEETATDSEKVEEVPVEDEPVVKPRKERKVKKIRPSTQVWKFYKIEGDQLKKLKKDCPRCGKGVFLAEHHDRETCGKCGYTQFKK